jgi:hypothetical protein
MVKYMSCDGDDVNCVCLQDGLSFGNSEMRDDQYAVLI